MKSSLFLRLLMISGVLGLSACTVTPARVSYYGAPAIGYDQHPPARVEIIAVPSRHSFSDREVWKREPPPRRWQENTYREHRDRRD